MNKSFKIFKLNNNVVFEFFDQSNRYFGDYHRVKIKAIVTIPFVLDSLPEDLRKFAATYPECIKYEKSLRQMGVASSEVQMVTESLTEKFIESVSIYLEKKNFAENLLRKNMKERTGSSFFRPE